MSPSERIDALIADLTDWLAKRSPASAWRAIKAKSDETTVFSRQKVIRMPHSREADHGPGALP
jgi:hypothetical protein